MSNYRYFTEEEFEHATPSCSLSDMDSHFMCLLDTARYIAGVPFIINSAYRSVDYELKKKRSGKSMHTLGQAVDLKCVDSNTRFKILAALFVVGFTGIGIGTSFIHVDTRPYPLVWTYD